VYCVLKELRAVIPYFFKQGRAVKIESLGTFTLRIALGGSFSIIHLPDKNMKAQGEIRLSPLLLEEVKFFTLYN
jgi:hypothetical protein